MEPKKVELRNLMEEAVAEALDNAWADEEMCRCEQCRMDIMAKALNNLPPRYVVTERGHVFTRADFLVLQKNIDVLTALGNAIRQVKKNPRHS